MGAAAGATSGRDWAVGPATASAIANATPSSAFTGYFVSLCGAGSGFRGSRASRIAAW